MKTFLFASGLALAALAAPIAAQNQSETDGTTIVVSAEHQKDWDRGNRIEAEGLRELEEAQRDLVRYSADVVDAQGKRDSSQDRANNARQAFESLTARPYFSNPDDARDWAKLVEETASEWKRFAARSDDGAEELRRAQRRQEKAQEAVEKAQEKIDEGREMMAEAELRSMRRASRSR